MYQGVDKDVRETFFSLDAMTLNKLFSHYEKQYGKSKRVYAEKTYRNWRSGTVKMSGEISERLIHLLPPLLSASQKYDLISKLWYRLQPKTHISVNVHPLSGYSSVLKLIEDTIKSRLDFSIPAALRERLQWLSGQDARASDVLLKQVLEREGRLIRAQVSVQVQDILSRIQLNEDLSIRGDKTIDIAGTTITICVKKTSLWRKLIMTEKREDNLSSGLQKADPISNLPIQRPDDLMGEALKGLTSSQRAELLGNAATEALRLQVKRKEGSDDVEIAREKMDLITGQIRRVSMDKSIEFRADAEHAGTRLEISRNRGCLGNFMGIALLFTSLWRGF